ncbi:cadmium-sensing regulator, CadC [Desulfoscipio geothermicus DSM 3669]|uniref:Cadmium-sensing regulator, CadC n=2 Tax=Desulfoscipio geothermicus TaxID=39060 RepID=A0A1I6CNR9_9FIRM|nr:cadmium-sensing regulator, CadC [Desulfoscipio geothermicus DSM 3669]
MNKIGVKMTSDMKNHVCETFYFDEEKVNRIKQEVVVTEGLGRLFKALADETRIKIIYALSREELCVCDVAQIIDATVAAASHHLRLLKNLGLARSRKQGKMVFYSLNDDCIETIIDAALKHYKGEHGLRK